MRMIARFQKLEGIRYLSHLDLQRAIARALRRSGLPLEYSKGFNPHPLLSLATALPVGMASLEEYMDIGLERDVLPKAFLKALALVMPPALPVTAARPVPSDFPKLTARIAAADYSIAVRGLEDAPWEDRLAARLAAPSFIARRQTKSGEGDIDVKPLVSDYGVGYEGDATIFVLRLGTAEGALIRPDVPVRALFAAYGVDPESVDILMLRTTLYVRGADGALISPLDAAP